MTGLQIVSGGQTGVDRAALDAALALDMSCGGWCPAGRRAEDGPIDDRYPLIETDTGEYAKRTLANVRDSDGTLILGQTVPESRRDGYSTGTALTMEAATKLDRPLYIVNLGKPEPEAGLIGSVAGWVRQHDISVLNIAGPRESERPGIYGAAYGLIVNLLPALVGDNFDLLP